MEQHQLIDDQLTRTLSFTQSTTKLLLDLSYWSKFISNVGFILSVFIIVVHVFYDEIYLKEILNEFTAYDLSFAWTSIIICILIIAICIPLYFLKQFSIKMEKAISRNNQSLLEESINNLKKSYQFIGLIIILLISVWSFLEILI